MILKPIIAAMLFGSPLLFAQVGINNETPDSSSALEIKHTEKGVLLPRLLQADINSFSNQIESLLLYNISANQFQAFNGTKWGQELFYSQEFWNVKGNPQTANNVTNIIGTADARVFTVRTNNIKSFTIQANGQIRMEGRNISNSRLNITGANIDSVYPAMVALHSTGFGSGVRYPNDITLTNTGNSTLKGNLAFSQTVIQAEAGISTAGISYLDTGSSNSGFSLYTGGHPSSIEDTSLERVKITSSGNVGIGISSPVSKVQVQDGDIYIQDSSRGIVINASGTNCYRITVNNSGTLATNLITCP